MIKKAIWEILIAYYHNNMKRYAIYKDFFEKVFEMKVEIKNDYFLFGQEKIMISSEIFNKSKDLDDYRENQQSILLNREIEEWFHKNFNIGIAIYDFSCIVKCVQIFDNNTKNTINLSLVEGGLTDMISDYQIVYKNKESLYRQLDKFKDVYYHLIPIFSFLQGFRLSEKFEIRNVNRNEEPGLNTFTIKHYNNWFFVEELNKFLFSFGDVIRELERYGIMKNKFFINGNLAYCLTEYFKYLR